MDVRYIHSTLQDIQTKHRGPPFLTPLTPGFNRAGGGTIKPQLSDHYNNGNNNNNSNNKGGTDKEKELTNVYSHIQHDIKQIKDDVLANLSHGGAVDYEHIKGLFEEAESEIQAKKRDLMQQFSAQAAVVPSSAISNVAGVGNQQSVGRQANSIGFGREDGKSGRKNTSRSGKSVSAPPPVSQRRADVEKLRSIINPAGSDARIFANSLMKKTTTSAAQPLTLSSSKSLVISKHSTASASKVPPCGKPITGMPCQTSA